VLEQSAQAQCRLPDGSSDVRRLILTAIAIAASLTARPLLAASVHPAQRDFEITKRPDAVLAGSWQETASEGGAASRLITSKEIQQVQPWRATKTSKTEWSNGSLQVSFYIVQNAKNSISLALIQRDPRASGKSDPRHLWKETLDWGKRRTNQENGRPSTLKQIDGLGDAAYWLRTQTGGSLYVLKANAFIRLQINGSDREDTLIEKAKILAQKAVKRL
jgi:hypothetical protein